MPDSSWTLRGNNFYNTTLGFIGAQWKLKSVTLNGAQVTIRERPGYASEDLQTLIQDYGPVYLLTVNERPSNLIRIQISRIGVGDQLKAIGEAVVASVTVAGLALSKTATAALSKAVAQALKEIIAGTLTGAEAEGMMQAKMTILTTGPLWAPYNPLPQATASFIQAMKALAGNLNIGPNADVGYICYNGAIVYKLWIYGSTILTGTKNPNVGYWKVQVQVPPIASPPNNCQCQRFIPATVGAEDMSIYPYVAVDKEPPFNQ